MLSSLRPVLAIAVTFALGLTAGCGRSPTAPSDAIMRGCATATACKIETGFESCIGVLEDRLQRHPEYAEQHGAIAACLAAAGTDCDAARRCYNGGQAALPCSGGSFDGTCSGDTLHYCDNGWTAIRACAAPDRCLSGQLGSASCGVDCSKAGCDGATVVLCFADNIAERQVCFEGLTCAMSPTTGIGCNAGTGEACSGTQQSCRGSVIDGCVGGRRWSVDCARYGLLCVNSDNGITCGLGNQCGGHTQPRIACSDGRFQYCYFGELRTVDCRARGFSGCDSAGCVM